MTWGRFHRNVKYSAISRSKWTHCCECETREPILWLKMLVVMMATTKQNWKRKTEISEENAKGCGYNWNALMYMLVAQDTLTKREGITNLTTKTRRKKKSFPLKRIHKKLHGRNENVLAGASLSLFLSSFKCKLSVIYTRNLLYAVNKSTN